MVDILYPCDPNKNVACNKRGCFINGGPCQETRHIEYADVAPVKEYDSDHIWYKGKQYISLKRVGEMMKEKTADVAPVKHGKWLYNNLWGTECSKCGTAMFEILGVSYSSFKPKYCPNCGAKMDK